MDLYAFTKARPGHIGTRAISRRGRIWHLSNRSSHPTSQPRALTRRRAAILASTRSRREKDEPRNEQRCRNKQPRRQDPTAATQHDERREPAVEAWQLREHGVFRWDERRERSESRKPRPGRCGRPRAHPDFPIGHGPSDEPSSDSRLERVAPRTRGSPAHGFPQQTQGAVPRSARLHLRDLQDQGDHRAQGGSADNPRSLRRALRQPRQGALLRRGRREQRRVRRHVQHGRSPRRERRFIVPTRLPRGPRVRAILPGQIRAGRHTHRHTQPQRGHRDFSPSAPADEQARREKVGDQPTQVGGQERDEGDCPRA